MADSKRPPLSPNERWLSDVGQVLHFRPMHWSRHDQVLEVTSGELLPAELVPLVKRRRELTREEAIRRWRQKRQQGGTAFAPSSGLTNGRYGARCRYSGEPPSGHRKEKTKR